MGKKKKRINKKKKSSAVGETCDECGISNKDAVLIEKLLKRAESCMNDFEYELAQKFLERALLHDPNNVTALESLAAVLLEMGNSEEANNVLLKAVQICPDTRHNIYFSLAQLNEGKQSTEYYNKGIEILEKLFANKEELEKNEDVNSLKKELSNAYCSVAEIYMTDCCFEEDAEEQCKINIDKGIATDVSNPECYQCLANYMLVKGNEEEAKTAMTKSLSLWLPQMQALAEGTIDPNIEQVCMLNYDSRINTSKLLIELEMFDEASEVLDGLIDEDDEVIEVWYLLGWLNYLRGKDYWGNACYYLKKAIKVDDKIKTGDPDQIIHANELLTEMRSEVGDEDENSDTNEDKENEMTDANDVNFDSESDENMEH